MKIRNFLLPSLIALSLLGATSCSNDTTSSSHIDQTSDVTTSLSEENNTTTETLPNTSEDNTTSESLYDLVKVSELIKIGEALENDTETSEKYYCKGIIEKIEDTSRNAITFKDDTGSIYCYRVNGKTNISPALKQGEELILQGTVKKYKNKPQFNYPQIIQREVKQDPPLTESECQEMNINEARNADKGSKVKVSGVVGIITKTQQFKDNGFYLIDNTGSIFVHSSEFVSKVEVGNKITILGQRDNYPGSSESNAIKQGYQGAIQLVRPVLISNDNKNDNKFNTTWIKETTIKEIIDTPLSTNITSNIYKVKAFIKKSSVNNNTILVLNDIDNYTGAIVYSCNKASDFSWLMPYDGKLVELYVAPHNVNVTESSYNYRLQPIQVIQELNNYTLNDEQKADYVATYHAGIQFRASYTSDPNLELISTFSEDLWDITNASISYLSDNENVVKITNNVLHCLNNGTANIKVSVTVNEKTISKTYKITVNKVDVEHALTVKQAIDATLNSTVTLKGIVSSKIANKDGVYVTDETGTIAVSLKNAQDLKDLHIGDEVIFKGTRDFKQKDANKLGGQSHIYSAELISNNYGNHPISTASYVSSTLKELKAMNEDIDHTTTVYSINGHVEVLKDRYSTTIHFKDEGNDLLLYSGKASDYSWLTAFENIESIEAHVMLCDWNQKGLKGAILSVTYNNVTTYNNVGLAN